MTFGLPCITAVSDKATRKSSAQERPLATRFAQIGAVITIRLPAFATVAATTADGTITPAFSPPQSPRSSSAAFLQRPPGFSEKSRTHLGEIFWRERFLVGADVQIIKISEGPLQCRRHPPRSEE